MFRADPTLRHLPARREQVVTIIESINQPQISIPGLPPQAAQAHLVALRSAGGGLNLFVTLDLAVSAETVVYTCEPREVAVASYAAAEAEGLQFLESMGFMLDNTNFRRLSAEAQEQALRRVPFLSGPGPGAAPRAASTPSRPSPRQALARLLAGS